MTQINRRVVRVASALAVAALCSCTSTYTPDQSSIQKMSVQEARNVVLAEAVSPAYFFDRRDESINLNKPLYMISKVYIRKTSIGVVTGYKRYNIPLMNLQPTVFRDDSDGSDYVDVYVNNLQGFYANLLSVNSAGYRSGLYDGPFNRGRPEHLAEALLVLKISAIKSADEDEARFQEAARTYRAAASKPELIEAARAFEIRAEGAVRDKDFDAAADFYEQALEIAPWWPPDHLNRALVLSSITDFPDAIIEMKRYLALAPDAPNARAAQDQIYDWERKASTAN